VVSMTFGRPSMTSHLEATPLPNPVSDTEINMGVEGDVNTKPSIFAFYVYTIELYRILDRILSDIYNLWYIGSESAMGGGPKKPRSGGLDVILEIDASLDIFESCVPPFLSWTQRDWSGIDEAELPIYQRQCNVLRTRYAPRLLCN
jgi:hypothetical protein